MVRRIAFNTEKLIQPLQNDAEALGLTHVLLALDETDVLRCPSKKTLVVVVDREDLVVHPVDEEQLGALLAVERAILHQRILHRLLLECFEVIAVPPFVCQCCGEVKRVLEIVDRRQPARVEHMVATAAERDNTGQTVVVGVC